MSTDIEKLIEMWKSKNPDMIKLVYEWADIVEGFDTDMLDINDVLEDNSMTLGNSTLLKHKVLLPTRSGEIQISIVAGYGCYSSKSFPYDELEIGLFSNDGGWITNHKVHGIYNTCDQVIGRVSKKDIVKLLFNY
jgi:hypothetical protein